MNYELREKTQIKSFTDLNVWKEGHKLVLLVYKMTNTFPKEEVFGLTSQMRRSAVSITSNIAEGFSRNTFKDKVQFYCIALGSLTELQNQLLIARDTNFMSLKNFDELANQAITVSKICNGLIKKSKSFFVRS